MLVAQPCLTLRPRGLQPARLLCPWDSPGKNAGVGCHSFSRGSSEPRSPALAGGFFTTKPSVAPRTVSWTLNENKPKLQAHPQVPLCLYVRAPCDSKSWRMDFQGRISWGELNCASVTSNGGIPGLLTSWFCMVWQELFSIPSLRAPGGQRLCFLESDSCGAQPPLLPPCGVVRRI